MASDRLQDFLATQLSEGEHDSEGQFTITGDEAIRKLSSLTLSNPLDWVLKAVQAAVAAGVSSLDFKRVRHGFFVEFHGLSEVPSLAKLESSIHSTGLALGTFLGELAIGLRTLLFQAGFALSLTDGESVWWDGHSFKREQLDPTKADLQIWVLWNGWSVRAARRHLQIVELLTTRALFCPIPLTIDSKRVDPSSHLAVKLAHREKFGMSWSIPLLEATIDPNSDSALRTEKRKPLLGLPFINRLKTPGFLLRYQTKSSKSENTVLFYSRMVCTETVSHEAGEEYDVQVSSGRCAVQFTRLGVICAETASPAPVDGTFLVEADRARSDLSGLQIQPPGIRSVIDFKTLTQMESLHHQIAEIIQTCETCRHLDKRDLTRGMVGSVGMATAMFAIVLGSGLMLPAALKLSASSGLFVGGWTVKAGSNPMNRKQLAKLAGNVQAFGSQLAPQNFFTKNWSETNSFGAEEPSGAKG